MKKSMLSLLFLCFAVSGIFANDLKNAGFEGDGSDWKNSFKKSSAKLDTAVFKNGRRSLCFTRKVGTPFCGYVQEVQYSTPDNEAIIFGGFVKADSIVLHKNKKHDFSIYLDIYYADGTATWAQRINLPAGTWDWKRFEKTFYPDKAVKKIRFYLFLREAAFGTVWFDDLFLERGSDDEE